MVHRIPQHQKEVAIHTHILDVAAIEPRRFYRHLQTYERPLDNNDPGDQELVRSVHGQGLKQPIVVFDAHEENELWLISGHRRLQAWTKYEASTVPAIVCRDFDTLLATLIKERDEADRDFVKPLTWTNRLDYGMILRGVQLFMRGHRKRGDGITEGSTHTIGDISEVLECGEIDWRNLRFINAGRVKYEKQERTVHNAALASALLVRLDNGEITPTQARELYFHRPNRVGETRKGKPVGAQRWRSSVDSLLNALDTNALPLEEFLQSVNGDITAEELDKIRERAAVVRRTLIRTENHCKRIIHDMEEVSP